MTVTNDFQFAGVYCIINTRNNHRYIGSSQNIYGRLQKQFSLLRHNNHFNYRLQNDWNEFGEQSFDFYVLEKCNKPVLVLREQFYVDTMKPEYNICTEVVSNTPSIESREKMSTTRKERIANGSIDCYQKKTIYQYDLDGNYMNEYESLVVAAKECGIDRTTIQRFFSGKLKKGGGYLWSFEKVDKMPKYVKPKKPRTKLYKEVIVTFDNNCMIFKSLQDCAKYFNVTSSVIGYVIKHSGVYLKKYKIKFSTAV